ncbi:MAG TPA: TIGR04283 family arsenosugar biosynthesis glycosyltransferase [Parvularculaceae bacterium]|nr:TIGR04283 family arsenosugar biosynthesis glycosyltransferase [Parvularculaceae bacterium]
MISVVIPTFNAAPRLSDCLEALVPAAVEGLVKEVVISDGGSSDKTEAIAEAAGAVFLAGPKGRGGQLARGAAAAHGRWLLFLHADTVLDPEWGAEALGCVSDEARAGVFTLAFDAEGLAPKLIAAGAMARTRLLKSPYGDQGLLISRALYDEIGGFAGIPLLEDVDIVRRIVRAKGRAALIVLKARAVTSAALYERDGYIRRVFKNARCLWDYHRGVPPARIAENYYR